MQQMPGEQSPLWIALLSAALLSGAAAGCGAPAAPLPPTLNLPQPVRDLAASRVGDIVRLTFTVPRKTTDKLPVRGAMTASLCRRIANDPCQLVGQQAISDQAKTVSMEDALPAELVQGDPRLLIYSVRVLNRAGQSAGDSAPAYAAAGAAPLPLVGFTVTPLRKGIVLSWQGIAATAGWVHFDRTRLAPVSGGPSPPSHALAADKSAEAPPEQAFRIQEMPSEHRFSTLDSTVMTGSIYRYVAQRINNVTLNGHELQIASRPSAPVETDYRDAFPPPVPIGLVSAADSAEKAIDLNWTPDVDSGLAGYIIYRRVAGSSASPQRISPADKPVRAPAWRDVTALPGQRYAYSVSAVDISGNESRRSAEVQDEWSADSFSPVTKP